MTPGISFYVMNFESLIKKTTGNFLPFLPSKRKREGKIRNPTAPIVNKNTYEPKPITQRGKKQTSQLSHSIKIQPLSRSLWCDLGRSNSPTDFSHNLLVPSTTFSSPPMKPSTNPTHPYKFEPPNPISPSNHKHFSQPHIQISRATRFLLPFSLFSQTNYSIVSY